MKPSLVIVALLGLFVGLTLIFMDGSAGGLTPAPKETLSGQPHPAPSPAAEVEVEDFIRNQSENQSLRWFFSDTPDKPNGVALVIHGLNLKPVRMQPVISKLTESGIDVLALSLRGHGANYAPRKGVAEDQARLESFKGVSYQVWLNEAYLAYLLLQERGAAKGVPLFLTAFSLGGLIGLDLFASYADVRFDKLVLFAPAIRLHAVVYLERVLAPFSRLVIPSMAPAAYLANEKGTPVAAYNALFEGLEHFDKHAGQKLNVPTLVFIDEQDEFIPLSKLTRLVDEKKWDQWRFYHVEKDKTADDERFYHHIIDASSTGKTTWHEMMMAVAKHLLNQTSH